MLLLLWVIRYSRGLRFPSGAGRDQPAADLLGADAVRVGRRQPGLGHSQLQQHRVHVLPAEGRVDSGHHHHELHGIHEGARLRQELLVVSSESVHSY